MKIITGYSGSGQPQYVDVPDPPKPTAPPPPAPKVAYYGTSTSGAPVPVYVAPPPDPPVTQPLPTPPVIVAYGGSGSAGAAPIYASQPIATPIAQPMQPIVGPILSDQNKNYAFHGNFLDGSKDEHLLMRQALVSTNGLYYAILRTDHNFVVYQGKYINGTGGDTSDIGGPHNPELWSVHSSSVSEKISFQDKPAYNEIRMQSNGGLVGYVGTPDLITGYIPGGGIPISKTEGKDGRLCVMEGNGNLVIYNSANQPIWDSFGTYDKGLIDYIGDAAAGAVNTIGGILTGNPSAVAKGVGGIAGENSSKPAGPPTNVDANRPLPPAIPVPPGQISGGIGQSISGLTSASSKWPIVLLAFIVLAFLWDGLDVDS
jgi:hypothetical protein